MMETMFFESHMKNLCGCGNWNYEAILLERIILVYDVHHPKLRISIQHMEWN